MICTRYCERCLEKAITKRNKTGKCGKCLDYERRESSEKIVRDMSAGCEKVVITCQSSSCKSVVGLKFADGMVVCGECRFLIR
jgi:hypothetical protein